MTQNNPITRDVLLDYALGQCDPSTKALLRQRLETETDLRRQHQDILNTLGALDRLGETDPPEDLTENTLERIRQYRQTNELLAREQVAKTASRPTFSLRELTTVAAVLLVLVSVFALLRRQAHQQGLSIQCSGRLGQIGTGLARFANDHDGQLPSTTGQGRWLPTGSEPAESNSGSLFKLLAGNYVPNQSAFRCPAVAPDENSPAYQVAGLTDFPRDNDISYSYQHSIGHRLTRDMPAGMAILADSSPLFQRGQFVRESLRNRSHEELASTNHGGRGQNVLYLDMHVAWAQSPAVGIDGDNIYLAGDLTDYTGTETPTAETDSFLLPAYTPTSATPLP